MSEKAPLQSQLSEREQGELQGALQSMRSITFIIGPWLFLRIFGWFIDAKTPIHLPGAPYFLAGALLFTAMLMATRVEQPQIQPVSTDAVPDVVPPESTPSAAIAPILDSEENV